MTGAAVTIAWTSAEAVLFGPESRLVRLPLAEDDDRAAMILETWRTEFPEISQAQLLAGSEAGVAPEAARLAQIAAQAGLKLEIAPPPGDLRPGGRSRWSALRRRLLRPHVAAAGALMLAAMATGAWQWSQARERDRLSKLTAAERETELRRAESAETGRRRQASSEQVRALLAACTVPRQFAAEWLAAVAAAVPPSVVIDAIELNGARCRLLGHTVAGGPGAETAVEGLRQSIFPTAAGWTVDNAASAATSASVAASTHALTSAFRLEATASAAGGTIQPEARPDVATAAYARLPDKITVESLLAEISRAWRIEAKGADATQGVEHRRYALTALTREPRAWTDVLQLAHRLNATAGIAIDSMTLDASPGESGGLDKAAFEVSTRLRTNSTPAAL